MNTTEKIILSIAVVLLSLCSIIGFACLDSLRNRVHSIAITESLDTIRLETQQRQLENELKQFEKAVIDLKGRK